MQQGIILSTYKYLYTCLPLVLQVGQVLGMNIPVSQMNTVNTIAISET